MSPATSMPPPPSPLAHRRSRLNSNNLSNTSSSSCTPEPPSCARRKMSLSKSATFHVSSSPACETDPVVSIPHLTHRSPTYSRSAFASWLYDGREAVSDIIADFEQTFSGARGSRPATRRRSAKEFEEQLCRKVRRPSSPVDSGIGSTVSTPSDKGLSQTLEKALDLTSVKDSALGDSIDDPMEAAVRPAQEQLIQEANDSVDTTPQTRQPGNIARATNTTRIILTRPLPPSTSDNTAQPVLSTFGRRRISENLIKPLLRDSKFKEFHPIVTAVGSRSNKNLRCLRDIEQSLIYQPLTLSVSPAKYRAFGELTVQLVVDTYQHLSESEQRRASDRPYDTGYFLDLVQQVHQLAAHIGTAEGNEDTDDNATPTLEDEITLEGGLADTGSLAELVRWRNGKGISLRTGQPYEALPGMKREHSTMLDEEIARSMARRKKGYIPEIIEMPCSDPTCDKVFTRKCDLSKHEKTHSRPYKCKDPRCKYHEQGLPTEKELDRHMNDKHNSNPKLYNCRFCEFKTKRESNCKQHMEKKHGWDYRRAKGKDKATGSTPSQTPQTPSLAFSPSLESPASYHTMAWDDGSSHAGSIAGSYQTTPYDDAFPAFDSFTPNQGYSNPLFPRANPDYNNNGVGFNFNAPINTNVSHFGGYASPAQTTPASATNMKMTTPQTPAYSTITSSHGPSPRITNMDGSFQNNQPFYDGMLTPDSAAQHSRHPSIANDCVMPPPPNPYQLDDMIMDDVPKEDFTLFGGSAFTNAAGADAMLFPGNGDFQSQDFTPEMFDFGNADIPAEFNDFEDFVEY